MKTAWITKDERYPDFTVEFKDPSNITAIKVQLTTQQASLVIRYRKIQIEFEDMCYELTKTKI